MLARFDHPSLVKVYRFWEANGTAYMAMPLLRGPHACATVRSGMVLPPRTKRVRRVLDAAAVGAGSAAQGRTCSTATSRPTTSCSATTACPVLLDFGAARRVIGEGNQALTSIMKPHFAPLEQYADQSAHEARAPGPTCTRSAAPSTS
jgi:hypothetical protein